MYVYYINMNMCQNGLIYLLWWAYCLASPIVNGYPRNGMVNGQMTKVCRADSLEAC